jgi:hypothetical protein
MHTIYGRKSVAKSMQGLEDLLVDMGNAGQARVPIVEGRENESVHDVH